MLVIRYNTQKWVYFCFHSRYILWQSSTTQAPRKVDSTALAEKEVEKEIKMSGNEYIAATETRHGISTHLKHMIETTLKVDE